MIPVLHGVWFAGGIGGDYEHIETITVGAGGASSITFSSIPGTYKHLQIRAISRDNASGYNNSLEMQMNGDTTAANYRGHLLNGNGSSATSGTYTGVSFLIIGSSRASTAGGSFVGVSIIDVLDYTSTSKYKTVRSLRGIDLNDANGSVGINSGLWMSTNAITSLTFFPDAASFVQYSSFSLYGVK